jgi:hypothetical protein
MFGKFVRWAWKDFSNISLIGGWVVSVGAFPTLLALTHDTTPIGYGIGAACGVLLFGVFRLCWNGARLMRATALSRERISSDSSPFDPMAHVFEGKRLHLRDLVPPGRRAINSRKFINCEIIGPGSIVVALRGSDGDPWPAFSKNVFWDVDMIQVVSTVTSNNATYFPDCSFEGCSFYNLNLLFYERVGADWHWITPDPAQPRLIEGPPLETPGKVNA